MLRIAVDVIVLPTLTAPSHLPPAAHSETATSQCFARFPVNLCGRTSWPQTTEVMSGSYTCNNVRVPAGHVEFFITHLVSETSAVTSNEAMCFNPLS